MSCCVLLPVVPIQDYVKTLCCERGGRSSILCLHYLLLSIYFNQESALQIAGLCSEMKDTVKAGYAGGSRVTSLQYFPRVTNYISRFTCLFTSQSVIP